jgi:hypothetical protein
MNLEACMEMELSIFLFLTAQYTSCLSILRKHLHVTTLSIPLFLISSVLLSSQSPSFWVNIHGRNLDSDSDSDIYLLTRGLPYTLDVELPSVD